ncbi:acyl-ACP--UDP-N-acetylglucosamine O-acyltransferase [bacterium]|nr:acyl-ACP--UDP-N-acetylglucosamine O-acyltransferase [bacterium]
MQPKLCAFGHPSITSIIARLRYGQTRSIRIIWWLQPLHTVIHSQAHIDPTAQLANDVSVGAHAIIEEGVKIGQGSRIAAYAIIKKNTTLGERVSVDHFAVVGGDPQDLSFQSSLFSSVVIGDDTIIREHATIHRATQPNTVTRLGKKNLIMVGAHIAHDCQLGDHVILANGCMLGGHVHVGDHAFISGGVAVHQFCRIGGGSMTSGNAVITEDVPPHGLAYDRNRLAGLNLIGLRRRGLSAESVAELKKAYHLVYATGGNCAKLADESIQTGNFKSPEALDFLRFFLGGKRGRFVQPA